MIEHPLKGKWIVVTRPTHQTASFIKSIEKVGGCLFNFPLIAITPFNDAQTIANLEKLIDYDIVIFVSSNAVEQCVNLIGTEILKNKTLATTGKKTALALQNNNLNVDFCPEKFFNSEALLAIDDFRKQAKGKKIAIIRGSTGRDYLKSSLLELDAKVDYFDVYSRYCPQQNLDELKKAWDKKQLDVVLLTSASSTACFFDLAKTAEWVNELTILIGSSRMQHEIPSQFKGKILIAEDPSDETLIDKLTSEL